MIGNRASLVRPPGRTFRSDARLNDSRTTSTNSEPPPVTMHPGSPSKKPRLQKSISSAHPTNLSMLCTELAKSQSGAARLAKDLVIFIQLECRSNKLTPYWPTLEPVISSPRFKEGISFQVFLNFRAVRLHRGRVLRDVRQAISQLDIDHIVRISSATATGAVKSRSLPKSFTYGGPKTVPQ